jgi:hypothetical protein
MKRNDFVLMIIVEGEYPTDHTFLKILVKKNFPINGLFS